MSTYIVAIEIGSSRIKGAVGVLDENDSLNIVAIEEVSLPAGAVHHGWVMNVVEVANRLKHLKKLLENNALVSPRKITAAYVGLGGRSMHSVPAEAEIDLGTEREVTQEIIWELRKKVINNHKTGKKVIEAVPVNYYVDDQLIATPIGIYGKEVKGKFNLIEYNEKSKTNIDRAFDEAGIQIKGFLTKMLNLEKIVLDNEAKLGCVLLDMGAETTSMSVYRNGALRFLVTIPMGSRLITKDLANVLKISEEKAEDLKIKFANVGENKDNDFQYTIEEIDLDLINNIVKARLSEIISNVKNQIDSSRTKLEDLSQGVYLTGGALQLKGIKEEIERLLVLKAKKAVAVVPISNNSKLNVPITQSLDVVSLLVAASKRREKAQCTTEPIKEIKEEKEPFVITEEKQKTKIDKKQAQKKPGFFEKIGNIFENMVRDDDYDQDDDEK